MVIRDVTACSRCGGDHARIEAHPLERAFAPPEAAPLRWTHWAPCPVNGQPIMFIVECKACGAPNGGVGHLCPMTADQARAHFAGQEEEARRRGLRVDYTGVDYAAVAREMSASDRLVFVDGKLWAAPPAPKTWMEVERNSWDGGTKYRNPARSLVAMMTCAIQDDGRAWIHFSVSHRKRIPTWGELVVAKEEFLGDAEAYQVLPPRARYVNIDPRVLNIFALRDPAASALPDFTRGTGAL